MKIPTIQPIPAQATHALRQSVLRPHQTLGEMAYPGDDDPATIHLGAIDVSEAVVGIVSLYREPSPIDPLPGDWRLRGMAVAPEQQGKGIGAALVAAGLAAVQDARGDPREQRVWCNARTPAVGFYKRQGFTPVGDPFIIPGIGEHVVMWIAVETQPR